jgi:hypothetical protein
MIIDSDANILGEFFAFNIVVVYWTSSGDAWKDETFGYEMFGWGHFLGRDDVFIPSKYLYHLNIYN